MGLRFFCVAGWGWVAGMGGCIAGCAHPLEKSAPNFQDTSIHRLNSDRVGGLMVGKCHLADDKWPRGRCACFRWRPILTAVLCSFGE